MAIERKGFLLSILGQKITFIDSSIELKWVARNCRGILDREPDYQSPHRSRTD